MKCISMMLLLSVNSLCSTAQRQFAYTDGAISLAYFDPGFSATYNYDPVKHLGLGIGTQAYVFHPAITSPHHFTPAVFADMRFRIRPEKTSQYFVLLDFGVNFYTHSNDVDVTGRYIYSVPNNNGIYFGLGLGYFLRLKDRGWGPYATVKLINNFYKKNEYDLVTNEQKSISSGGGTLILSLGFRFGNDSKNYKTHPAQKDN